MMDHLDAYVYYAKLSAELTPDLRPVSFDYFKTMFALCPGDHQVRHFVDLCRASDTISKEIAKKR